MVERYASPVLEAIRDRYNLPSVSAVKARVIVNGGPKCEKREGELDGVTAAAKKFGLKIDTAVTKRPKHAPELLRTAKEDGVHIVFISGGDGTVKEIIDEQAKERTKSLKKDTDIIFGILPTGTMNVTARAFKTPLRNSAKAMEALLRGTIKPIDLVHMFAEPHDQRILDEYAIINAGIGEAAKMIELVEASGERGIKAYAKTAYRERHNVGPQKVNYINLETGDEHAIDARIVEATNGGHYGGLFNVHRNHPYLDDGQIDAFAVPNAKFRLLQTAMTGAYTFARKHMEVLPHPPGVIYERGSMIAVQSSIGEPLQGIHGDGEVISGINTEIIIFQSAPGYVHMLVPQQNKNPHFQK